MCARADHLRIRAAGLAATADHSAPARAPARTGRQRNSPTAALQDLQRRCATAARPRTQSGNAPDRRVLWPPRDQARNHRKKTRKPPQSPDNTPHTSVYVRLRGEVSGHGSKTTQMRRKMETQPQSIRTTPKAGLKPRFTAADASDRKEEKSPTTASVSVHELGRGRKSRADVGVTDDRKRKKSWLFNTINRRG